MNRARILPEETSVLQAAAQARAAGQHLLCNGRQSCISPVLMPGWSKLAVLIKPTRTHPIEETQPCAA